MTVVLVLRPIPVDPARREEEPLDAPTEDTEWGFHPGAAFPRRNYPYRATEESK